MDGHFIMMNTDETEEVWNMKKSINLLLILSMILSMLFISSCGKNETQSKTIIDMSGSSVELPEKIDRVISCSRFPAQ